VTATGADKLTSIADDLTGRRVVVVADATAVLNDLTPTSVALVHAGARVVRVLDPKPVTFSSEPAFEVPPQIDQGTGAPVTLIQRRSQAELSDLVRHADLLVYDLQETGWRCSATLPALEPVLRAAAVANVPVLVLDRPDPLGALAASGPLPFEYLRSAAAPYSVPFRYGLTLGELALLLASSNRDLDVQVEVLAVDGWEPGMTWTESALPWIPPSPDLPTWTAAACLGAGALGGSLTLADGRGTGLPFQQYGAPGFDGHALAEALNRLGVPGVRVRPTAFTPGSGRHAGFVCQGIQLHVVDEREFDPFAAGVYLAAFARRLDEERVRWIEVHGVYAIDRVLGSPVFRELVDEGGDPADLLRAWRADARAWWHATESHRRYPRPH